MLILLSYLEKLILASLQKEYTPEKQTGQVYTPCHIVCKILDEVGYYGKNILGKKILEPSCGDGQFLIEIAKRIIAESPIQDLQKNMVPEVQKSLFPYTVF